MHMRDLLVRGMLAGCLASVVAFGVATAIAESNIDAAIALEEQHAAEAHTHDALPSGEDGAPRPTGRSGGGRVSVNAGAPDGSTAVSAPFALAISASRHSSMYI